MVGRCAVKADTARVCSACRHLAARPIRFGHQRRIEQAGFPWPEDRGSSRWLHPKSAKLSGSRSFDQREDLAWAPMLPTFLLSETLPFLSCLPVVVTLQASTSTFAEVSY